MNATTSVYLKIKPACAALTAGSNYQEETGLRS